MFDRALRGILAKFFKSSYLGEYEIVILDKQAGALYIEICAGCKPADSDIVSTICLLLGLGDVVLTEFEERDNVLVLDWSNEIYIVK